MEAQKRQQELILRRKNEEVNHADNYSQEAILITVLCFSLPCYTSCFLFLLGDSSQAPGETCVWKG